MIRAVAAGEGAQGGERASGREARACEKAARREKEREARLVGDGGLGLSGAGDASLRGPHASTRGGVGLVVTPPHQGRRGR